MDTEARDSTDQRRRKFLIAGTTVVGGAIVVSAIVPFVESMNLDSAVGVRNEPYAVDFFGISTAPQFTKSVKTHCGTNSYESCACPCSSDFNCRI